MNELNLSKDKRIAQLERGLKEKDRSLDQSIEATNRIKDQRIAQLEKELKEKDRKISDLSFAHIKAKKEIEDSFLSLRDGRVLEIRGLQEINQHQAEHIGDLQKDLEYALIACNIYMGFFGGSDLEDRHKGIMLLSSKRTALRYIEKLLKDRPYLISDS